MKIRTRLIASAPSEEKIKDMIARFFTISRRIIGLVVLVYFGAKNQTERKLY